MRWKNSFPRANRNPLKPLALLCFSNALLSGQLLSRLQDMGYRVHTVHDVTTLQEVCEREKPIVLLVEFSTQPEVGEGVSRVKKAAATAHIPVLAICVSPDKVAQAAAEQAGVTLLAGTAAVQEHLPQLLDKVLEI